jgi:hypothetical protein
VFRYEVAAARSTLWIDPETPGSPGVTAVDSQAPVSISSIGLRQNSAMGNIYIDDLQISAIAQPAITEIRVVGGNVEVDFTAGAADAPAAFELLHSSDIAAPFASVTATITSPGPGLFRATVPAAGAQGFYRVKRQPLAF